MRLPTPGDLQKAFANRFLRAAAITFGLLALSLLVGSLLAGLVGGGASALLVLFVFSVFSAIALGLATPKNRPPPTDDERALESFRAEPLGQEMAAAAFSLTEARRKVGRAAPMHKTLDRLVKVTRRLERRAALDPEFRAFAARQLKREMPLLASTAERYATVTNDSAPALNAEKLETAEAVLVATVTHLDRLANGAAEPDRAAVRMIRLDAEAELLAETIHADLDHSRHAANGARLAHRLRELARDANPGFAADLRKAASEAEREGRADSSAALGNLRAALGDGVVPPDSEALQAAIQEFIAQGTAVSQDNPVAQSTAPQQAQP